jgi:hypothetical protein
MRQTTRRKIGRLEDWKIGRLEDFARRVVCLMEDCAQTSGRFCMEIFRKLSIEVLHPLVFPQHPLVFPQHKSSPSMSVQGEALYLIAEKKSKVIGFLCTEPPFGKSWTRCCILLYFHSISIPRECR